MYDPYGFNNNTYGSVQGGMYGVNVPMMSNIVKVSGNLRER